MKLAATVVTVAALAVSGFARADALEYHPLPATARVPAQEQLVRLAAREQQDEARYRVCDAQRAKNLATGAFGFTADGRRCLIDALDRAVSVRGTLVLLRNASATLFRNPEDRALHSAALRAVDKAREQMIIDGHLLQRAQPAAPGSRFAEQAAALDVAEFSIHLPQLHREQQTWRLEAFWATGKVAAQD